MTTSKNIRSIPILQQRKQNLILLQNSQKFTQIRNQQHYPYLEILITTLISRTYLLSRGQDQLNKIKNSLRYYKKKLRMSQNQADQLSQMTQHYTASSQSLKLISQMSLDSCQTLQLEMRIPLRIIHYFLIRMKLETGQYHISLDQKQI